METHTQKDRTTWPQEARALVDLEPRTRENVEEDGTVRENRAGRGCPLWTQFLWKALQLSVLSTLGMLKCPSLSVLLGITRVGNMNTVVCLARQKWGLTVMGSNSEICLEAKTVHSYIQREA